MEDIHDRTWTIDDYCGELSYRQERIKLIPKSQASTNMSIAEFHEMRSKINVMEHELWETSEQEMSGTTEQKECQNIVRTILSTFDD